LHPQRLFLIDGIGAFVTAVFLFAILKSFNDFVGMPQPSLILLLLIALVFCIYSISCFFILKRKWQAYLQALSIANLLYCAFTLGLVIFYLPRLTTLGLVYFLIEIAVIVALAIWELSVLKLNNAKTQP